MLFLGGLKKNLYIRYTYYGMDMVVFITFGHDTKHKVVER